LIRQVYYYPRENRASAVEAAFSDSCAVLETLEQDINSPAPKNGADRPRFDKTLSDSPPQVAAHVRFNPRRAASNSVALPDTSAGISVEEIVLRLKSELEPAIREAARQAAAHEHDRTREWLESRGLPKAARVAQHEAYNVLRKYGMMGDSGGCVSPQSGVGQRGYTPPESHALSSVEIEELAQGCVAMFEAQGRPVERTLSEMSTEAGGFLLPDAVARLRSVAESLLQTSRGQ
jgi:hypothetical protein